MSGRPSSFSAAVGLYVLAVAWAPPAAARGDDGWRLIAVHLAILGAIWMLVRFLRYLPIEAAGRSFILNKMVQDAAAEAGKTLAKTLGRRQP